MVAIGVGLSDVTNLAKIASNNAYFNFKSFDDLRNVFTHLNRTPTSPPKIGVIARGAHSATLQVYIYIYTYTYQFPSIIDSIRLILFIG